MRAVHPKSRMDKDKGIDGHDIPLAAVLMLSPCAQNGRAEPWVSLEESRSSMLCSAERCR